MNTVYLSEKQIRRKKIILKLKIYGGLFISGIFIIGVLYFIIYSSILRVVKIKIMLNKDSADGAELGQNNKIVDDFKIFLASRSKLFLILGPDNIISWTGNFNIKNFLDENLMIDDLQIKKDYLSRQITFEIKKREKFSIWCAGECWWFDKSGKIFEKAPQIEGEMIYKINDFSNRQLTIGSQIIEKNLFDNLLKIFNVIERAELNIRTINLKDLALQEVVVEPLNIQLPKLYFSLRFDPSFTMDVIQKLIKENIFKKIKYIDFRVENRTYYILN